MSVYERFKQITGLSQFCGCLFSRNALISEYDSEMLSEDCPRFEAETEDIEASDLESECAQFVYVLKEKTSFIIATDMLNFIYMNHSYANLEIALTGMLPKRGRHTKLASVLFCSKSKHSWVFP